MYDVHQNFPYTIYLYSIILLATSYHTVNTYVQLRAIHVHNYHAKIFTLLFIMQALVNYLFVQKFRLFVKILPKLCENSDGEVFCKPVDLFCERTFNI